MLPRLCLAVTALLLAGCGSLAGLRNEHVATPAPPSNEAIQAAQLARYVGDLQTVVQGSPTEQAEVLASARAGYDQAKQGPAALRLGLLLAAPGHPARDAVQARRLLLEALARPELLNILERALAVVELQRVEAELRLVTEGERLVVELQKERERQRTVPNNAALTKRLQNEIDENARLRRSLEDAKAKLDAIATIERNISNRPPGAPAAPANEGRNP
jgi:hypothetical protein